MDSKSLEMVPHQPLSSPKVTDGSTPANEGDGNSNKVSAFDEKLKRAKATAQSFGEHGVFAGLMSIITIWTLYQSDIRLAGTGKEADPAFLIIASIIFFMFLFEILLQSFYKDGYCNIPQWKALPGETLSETWNRRIQVGSFYFWLDWIATLTLIFDLTWMLGEAYDTVNGTGGRSASTGGAARSGAKAGRVVRLVRMVRLIRMVKLYKYAVLAYSFVTGRKDLVAEEEDASESRVGAAMSDLTNRRVIVLILLMLVVIPSLTVNDPDVSLSLGAQMLHNLGYLNSVDPSLYQTGLDLAVTTIKNQLPLIALAFNGVDYFVDQDRYDKLRGIEMMEFELTHGTFETYIAFDQKSESVNGALFSIYTTSFVIVLLLVGIYFFSADVNKLVIGPIERLVELVRKISVNPLGVEYKMLGEKEGFVEGMETTILLTTITKIGALMRVGFGEAGASVIAKNLSESSGGKLNLMGSGTMINSIFGFCDVRQFTDTTECLQEEVMLFVNRIAHILHSIVVQCSGAANKNIGDAFLLTWKIDDKLNQEQVSLLADQALLTFCKALIELARYQDFICNFSVAATARLYKRFPDYNVRIGSGLHVGWAIEGAIGSNRKIDASYLSPHVSATEFLESSTKAYGVSLLLSEPFYRLLSPAANKYCRQVDRVRRTLFEEPMGIYTYDSDLTINWNDPYRNKAKDAKARLLAAAKKMAQTTTKTHTHTNSSNDAVGRRQSTAAGGAHDSHLPHRKQSKDIIHHDVNFKRRASNFGVGGAPVHSAPINEVDENDPEAGDEDEQTKADKAKRTPTLEVPPYTQQVWTEDQDLVDLRHRVSDAMRALWEQGINAYIKGDWPRAREVFLETNKMANGNDGPSKTLLEFMDECGGTAPSDWHGYRMEGGGH